MKHKVISEMGRFLMKINALSICIVDDEEIYFNERMMKTAEKAGFTCIDRFQIIDEELLNRFQEDPYDIVIMDIKGVAKPDVAKDGMQVASLLNRTTNSYIVITSAHQFHLVNEMTNVDYVIENKLLTSADFIDELIEIVEDFIYKKSSFYKKILFKTGFSMVKNVAV